MFITIGFSSFLLSLYFAFSLGFNHFYEFLLIGLFFILLPFTLRHFHSFRLFLVLYLSIIILGLFIDLLIGLSLFKLWYYSYSKLFEYLLLYTLVYPLGGIVMLQSFLLGKSFIKTKKTSGVNNLKTGLLISSIILLMIGIFSAVSKAYFVFSTWAVILAVLIVLFVIISINTVSEMINNQSYIRKLINSPVNIILVTLIATYVNAFIHEYPNIFAGQWVYTAYINPFLNTPILGIPLLVLLVWPTLMIFSISIYYLWKPIFIKNRF